MYSDSCCLNQWPFLREIDRERGKEGTQNKHTHTHWHSHTHTHTHTLGSSPDTLASAVTFIHGDEIAQLLLVIHLFF